jgi:RNA polymerase sigma-70 factor (ECF subfamily)
MSIIDIQDKYLTQLLSEGNDSERSLALSELYKKYSKDIFAYLMYYTRNNQALSKDILQDVFILIYEKAHLFKSSQNFKPWAIQIASNLCKNKYKRENIENKYISSQKNNATQEAVSGNQENINKAIRSLDWNFREVLILKYKLEMSISEIADLLNIPQGTVKSRLYNASKALAKTSTIKNLKA